MIILVERFVRILLNEGVITLILHFIYSTMALRSERFDSFYNNSLRENVIISVLIDFASTRQHESHHAPSIHQAPLPPALLPYLQSSVHYQEDGRYDNNTTPLSDDNIANVK